MDRDPSAEPDLPGDLGDLEGTLLSRPLPAAPATLRDRVLAGVRAERRKAEAHARWSFAAWAAALAAIWVNLAAISSMRSAFPEVSRASGPPVAALAEEIRRVLPQVGEEEAVRQAAVYGAGPRPGPCALPPGAGRSSLLRTTGNAPFPKETASWDTPFSGS